MQINDKWKIEDRVSGLKFEIKIGTKLDVLHIESLPDLKYPDTQPKMNRDFFFRKDGGFDGTGSVVNQPPPMR